MGQKVNPNGFRYGITKEHQSKWYADKKDFAKYLLEDEKIRTYVLQFTRKYLISKVEISRNQKEDVVVNIHSGKPGAMLGQGGENLKKLSLEIQKATRNRALKLSINIIPIKNTSIDAKLIAEDIAIQLENRGSFRRAQKMAIRNALRGGAVGIKTKVSGRLNGADMARSEGYTEGIMALHTLRQNIDYGTATARTTYGAIGIKIWISLGQVLDGGKK